MINRKVRTIIYLAVEGEGEQSFVKWLKLLSDDKNLYVHLACKCLNGGGYQSMLKNACSNKPKAKASILLVDADRDRNKDDGWSIKRLREEAHKHGFQVCVQNPNLEGLFLRMFKGNERLQPDAARVKKELPKFWRDYYQNKIDADVLASKFLLADLLRVAKVDSDLNRLLSIIGLN